MQKGVLVLVLALALVIAGCQGGGKGTVSSSSTPFIGGSEGLKVSFVENAPPSEVLDNPKPADQTQVQKFDVILRVENAGEQDVASGNIKTTIGGIYPADFGKTAADLQNVLFSTKLPTVTKLTGVKKDPDGAKIPGDVEELPFKDFAYIKQLQGNAVFPLQADVCYKYATNAVGDFCMRADLTRTQGGVCQAKGTKPVFSSGSPIQVTSVDESIGGRTKVILKFNIKTVGSGSFFKPDATGAPTCARGDFSKENFVRVTVNSGVAGLTCSGFSGTPPTGDVRLTNGEGIVTCLQDGVSVDAVQKVNLQIEYNHLVSASTSILVKHLPGFDTSGAGGSNQPCTADQTGGAACTTTGCYAGHMATPCVSGSYSTPYCKADNPSGNSLCAGTSTPVCSGGACVSAAAQQQGGATVTSNPTYSQAVSKCTSTGGTWTDPTATTLSSCTCSGTNRFDYYPNGCVPSTTPAPPPVPGAVCEPGKVTIVGCQANMVNICQTNGQWLSTCVAR